MTVPSTASKQTSVTIIGIVRWVLKTFVLLAIFAAGLFLSAGKWDWSIGWWFIAMMAVVQVLNALVLIPIHPDLIIERSKLREGTKPWDMVLSPATALIGPLLVVITAGLDERWGWSPQESLPLRMIGLLVGMAGGLFALWAMASNPFFAATVRIQTERGHRVSSGGPYRLVRHPGYAGGVLFHLFTPLALSAPWAYIPALLTIAMLLLRTALEDRTLQDELPGYREYVGKVRSRIFPGIW